MADILSIRDSQGDTWCYGDDGQPCSFKFDVLPMGGCVVQVYSGHDLKGELKAAFFNPAWVRTFNRSNPQRKED